MFSYRPSLFKTGFTVFCFLSETWEFNGLVIPPEYAVVIYVLGNILNSMSHFYYRSISGGVSVATCS